MLAVLIVGLLMNAVAVPLAVRRGGFLYRLISSGQPAPDRIEGVTKRTGVALTRQLVEVLGQKKMLKWTVPGAAHFFVMWAFFILGSVYLEAYGSLVKLLLHGGSFDKGEHLSWAIPIIGHWAVLGFLQDFIAVMCLVGLATFVWIRVKNAPKDLGRKSRFFGSHLGPAWFTLFMIFNVIWSLFLFRGAGAGLEPGAPTTFPYANGAWVSLGVGKLLSGIATGPLEVIEGVGLLLHIGIALAFLIFVLNSKHLHIFLAPLNIMFGRYPVALGAAKPMMSGGKALTLADLEDLDEDAKLGVGTSEDFSWKGILDFSTCTECGRCQDQCPAWNTEKPLSPKLMIMALRDSQMAKAPYLLAPEDKREALLEGDTKLRAEVERPLVADTGDEWFYMPEDASGVIDPDVLWSCVTCGACVNQCPVDIEHVDHIIDMRRYQVLVESNFPAELNGLFKGMEGKGNPWNMSSSARLDWAKDLPFEVKVVGEDIESLDEVDWLFWVGCAGAYEDRAKKTTRAVAELLDLAGVSFGVLGNGETCTGDSARRAGNEFLFQGLAAENIETFTQYKVKKVVSTCAHCFNTLKNEYKDLGIELEVVHHTQLLNRLVREKKLTPVAAPDRADGAGKRSVTYHDPCYIGRHNQVYAPPRELLAVIPDADFVEMPRNSERSFCCGAGGARMWMEEKIGSRINETRTKEAIETGADQIAVGCPFCRVMLSDGLTNAQSKGEAREEVEVLDVAQMLLASIKGEAPKKAPVASAAQAKAGSGTTLTKPADPTAEDTKDEPEVGDTTQTENTLTKTEDVGPAAKGTGGGSLFDEEPSEPQPAPANADTKDPEQAEAGPRPGGSLFNLGGDDDSATEDEPTAKTGGSLFDEEPVAQEKAEPEKAEPDKPAAKSGGSLFDVEDDADETPAPSAKAEATSEAPARADLGSGGSLFDVEETDEPEPAAGSATADEAGEDPAGDSTTDKDDPGTSKQAATSSGTTSTPATEIPSGGSLFDIEEPEEQAPAAAAAPAAEVETETEEVEDAAADSTTDGATDRAQDDADTDVEVEDAPEAAPVAAKPSGTLFDIAAPRAKAAPTVAAEPKAEPEPEMSSESSTETPIRSLEDIKAGAKAADPDVEPDAASAPDASPSPSPEADAERDDEAEAATVTTAEADAEEEAPQQPADDKPKAATSGESHAPKTDVDIAEGGSLFDL